MASNEVFEQRLDRLWASDEEVLKETYAGIVAEWEPIDDAVVESGLIPRYQQTFTDAGLNPVFLVFHQAKTRALDVEHRRSVVVVSDEERIKPGFSVVYLPDRLFEVQFYLEANGQWREELPEVIEERRVPYWWPEDYSTQVHDFSDPLAAVYRRSARIDNPFPQRGFFGQAIGVRNREAFPDVWQQEETQELVNQYFTALAEKLSGKNFS